MQLTIGADPEVFLRKGTTFFSGHTLPCGTKEHPRETKHGSVQVDGLALEFNCKPATNAQDFYKNITGVFNDLSDIVKAEDPEYHLDAVPTVLFGRGYMRTLPRGVKRLGCDPDFNAYTMQPNPRPNPNVDFRTGAGHVHLGFTENANIEDPSFIEFCSDIVKECDYYLGLWSLEHDRDEMRRTLYGKAGAFRPKPYGVEYRTLSNFWLNSPELITEVFRRATRAFESAVAGPSMYTRYLGIAAIQINSSNIMWPVSYPAIVKDIA